MNKSVYLFAITIVTVFCVISGVVRAAGNFPFSFFSRYSSGAAVIDAFDSIDADADIMELTIEAKGTEYEISYDCTENLTPEWNISDGRLELSNRMPKKHLIFGSNTCKVTLTVPESTALKTVSANIDVGNILLKGLSMEQCSLTADVGNITMKNTTLNDGILASDTGNITLTDSAFTTLDARSDVGNVQIGSSRSLSGYSLLLSADIGSIKVNGGNMGRSYQKDGNDGKLTITASIGDVRVND